MNGVSGAMRFPILDMRSRNLSRVAVIALAAAAAGGCSSDTGRFGGDPVYTGSTPNQRAILGSGQPQQPAPQNGNWRNVETTGSIAPAAPQVSRQPLAQPIQSAQPQPYAVQPPVVQPPVVQAPMVQPQRVVATGWTGVGGSYVTAQHGDTVDGLSRRYGVPANAIAQVNGFSGGGALQPGQRVLMPVYGSNAPAPMVAQAPAPVAAAAPPPAQPVRQIAIAKPAAAPARAPMPVAAPTPVTTKPTVAPTPIPAPARRVAAAPSAPEPGGVKLVGDYTVRQGDTLASVARTYGVSERALKERNGLKSSSLQPGQHLLLPAGTKLMLKTSQVPAKSVMPEAPIPAPVKQVAQAPIAKPATAASLKSSPSSTAKIDQRAAETIAVAKEPAVEEPSGSAAPGSFRWPVRGRVIAEFGSKPNGEKNEGINLAVPEGTSVKAADDGEVIYSGNELKGYGNLVLVRHHNGYVTAYAHASELLVNRGDKISRGQIIARAGATGSVSQPQLHFELRKGQRAIDPKPYLASN